MISHGHAVPSIDGMLHEISDRHTTAAIIGMDNDIPKAQYTKMLRSYRRLADLVLARDGERAEAHWRRHMENATAELLRGYEKTEVRDIMD